MKKFLLPLALTITFAVALLAIAMPRPLTLPEPPLKDLAARHGLELGNHAIFNRINEAPYRSILTTQFSFALADNTPNWYFTDGGLRPSADRYNFSQMDELLQFTKKHSMSIQAHHYIWGDEKWLPEWLKKGDYSPAELRELMRQHILTVGGRYSGQIREWTVVNEAFTRKHHLYGLRDWWADHTGDIAYIDDAFRWARQADPHSKLILNDFGNENFNPISNEMFEYIKAAKTRGVPIDGIGMQMHIDGTHPPKKDEVIANMNRFGELGVDVYVTEFDINMNDLQTENDDRDRIAGLIYYEMLRACIESKVCHSFAYLGITDKESWYNYLGIPNARPLMFDDAYNPKPAFYGVRRALEEQ